MGLFEWLRGTPSPPKEPWANWGELNEETQPKVLHAYLERVAQLAEAKDVAIGMKPEDHEAELRGKLHGYPFRIKVSFSGSVQDFQLRYESDLEYIDLEYDPELEKARPGVELEPWDESEKRHMLAPGIFVEGSSADEELAAFRGLPPALQERVLEQMRKHRIRYFRSRRTEHDNTLLDDASEVSDPVAWLAAVLRLSADVALARGAAAPGSAKRAAAASPGGKRFGGFESMPEEQRWQAGLSYARELARKIGVARVVERPDAHAIDVRWTEQGVPLRLELDLTFGHVGAYARAQDVEAEFELFFDEEVDVEPAADPDPDWDVSERHFFFARGLYLQGSELRVLRDAALLHALPQDALAALIAVSERAQYGVELEHGVLHVLAGELEALTDEALPVELARQLVRVALSLPRASPTVALGHSRCSKCGSFWFPSLTRTTCPHCS